MNGRAGQFGSALITGSAHGLGRALCEAVLGGGGRVVGVDMDLSGQEDLEQLGGGLTPVLADLAETGSLDTLAARLADNGPFDLVVMNAGINATGPFEDIPFDLQAEVIAVNLVAPMILTAGLLRAEAIERGGSLVFIASLSHFVGYPGASAYAASKDGLASFARSLRRPLARDGIRVLTAFPGPLDTGHAARHAPPGSQGATRMAPERAAAIIQGAARRGGTIVPGGGPKVAALLGRLFPDPATATMRRTIYERLANRE